MDLHSEFVRLGKERNKITYQLLALLPEIHRLEIHRAKGYESIYEYAGKLAGLSKTLVDKSLRVSAHLKEKPCLQKAVSEVGIHKVALVAKLATPETEKAWADKVRHMSKKSLFELAKEVRQNVPGKINMQKETTCNGNNDKNGVPCKAAKKKMIIEFDEEMQFLFLNIKKKLGRNLSHRKILREILISYAGILTDKKNTNQNIDRIRTQNAKSSKFFPGKKLDRNKGDGIGQERIGVENRTTDVNCKTTIYPPNCKRYIPVSQKREALIKSKGRCGYPSCGKPPDAIHHRKRFSETKSHESIVPLCKEHHEFMHNGLIENEMKEPNEWRLLLLEAPEKMADFLFRQYRIRVAEDG